MSWIPGSIAEPALLSEHSHPQAPSPLWLQAQVLIIFDEVFHHLVNMAPNSSVIPLDAADTTLVSISLVAVVITAVRVALTARDLFPQFADLSGLPDIPTHHVAIEKVSRMDVVAPPVIAIPLLH